jgi:peptidoglycan/LPS O-acetylase OafA/YrhL
VALYTLPLCLLLRAAYRRKDLLARLPSLAWAGLFVLGVLLVLAFEPVKTHSPYHKPVDLAQFSIALTPAGLAGVALACVALLAAFSLARPWAWLGVCGRYSMPIYLMHYGLLTTPFFWIRPRLSWMGGDASAFAAALACCLAAVLLPIAVSKLMFRATPHAHVLGMAR